MTARSTEARETHNARVDLRHDLVVASTGYAYPSDVVDNDAFFARCAFDIGDRAALEAETRMRTRRWCRPDENTWTMARDAARMAAAGIDAREIDVVLVSSCSTIPGYNVPDPENPVIADLAPLLLADLGRDDAIGIDYKATYCAGFIRGLQLLDGLMQNPNYRAGMLVCSDVGGRFATAETNRSAFCFLIGDAAGAVVVRRARPGEPKGIVDYTGAMVPSKGHLTSWGPDGRSIVVRGRSAGAATLELLLTDARRLLQRNALTPADVDWLLPMQTHKGAVDALCAELGWPRDKLLWFGDETGYSASASIPATLGWKRAEGVVKPGDLVMVLAVGAGMNSGGALIRA